MNNMNDIRLRLKSHLKGGHKSAKHMGSFWHLAERFSASMRHHVETSPHELQSLRWCWNGHGLGRDKWRTSGGARIEGTHY